MTVGIGIVAHARRFHQARMLRKVVDAQCVSWDYGNIGARANHLSVWNMLGQLNTDWSLVLEDDAVVVNNFREQLDAVLAHAPTPVVSLYLGTGNPKCWQPRIERALVRAQRRDAHWLVCRNVIHAVAVAVPTRFVPEMLRSLYCGRGPIDEDLTRYVVRHFGVHHVGYPVPSLCDHADGPTLITHHTDGRSRSHKRNAWMVGTREYWNIESVALTI